MSDLIKLKEIIHGKINNDVDWANPYWLDEIKEEYEDVSERKIDDIYAEEMKSKVDSMSKEEARSILDEQNSETSANQNYFLADLLEQKLELTP